MAGYRVDREWYSSCYRDGRGDAISKMVSRITIFVMRLRGRITETHWGLKFEEEFLWFLPLCLRLFRNIANQYLLPVE